MAHGCRGHFSGWKMAANKEAIVMVLDVGPYMSKKQAQSDQASPLDVAKECIAKIIQRKIFAESKDEIALVLNGTTETKNDLALSTDGEYLNITVAYGLQQANFELIKFVESIKGTDVMADLVDSLVIGVSVLVEQTKGQKFGSLRLLMFTNFGGTAFDDKLDIIMSGMKNANIQLNVIGPQTLDEDEEDDENEESEMYLNQKMKLQDFRQRPVKSLLKKVLDAVTGDYYTFSEALPVLTYFQKKPIHSATWNAILEIGELQIPITACIKISEWKQKSWKTAHAVNPDIEIIHDRTYHLNDDNQTEVDKANIIQGYQYGTTLVPYTKEDEDNMKYKSGERGMKIVGFTKEVNVKRHYYMGDRTMYVVGRKNDEPSQMAIAALIHALYETSSVAIVRYVYAKDSPPRMGFLAPRIKSSYKALFYIQLPYVEDVRHYPFASLTSKKSTIPTEEQLAAIDNLITRMDLSIANEEEDENELEVLKPSNCINPYLERLYQCLHYRAFHPSHPLPPVPPHVNELLQPPEKLVSLSKPFLEAVKKLFPLEPVLHKKATETGASVFQNGGKGDGNEPQSKRQRMDDEAEGMADVLQGSVKEVGTVDPVSDFKKLINQDPKKFANICKQLQVAMLQLINNPRGYAMPKVSECLKVYREEALKREPMLFNAFMSEIRPMLMKQHRPLWDLIVQNKMGLIGSNESNKSSTSPDECSNFLSQDAADNEAAKDEPEEEDADELLDMM